jgi:hypothetical protein
VLLSFVKASKPFKSHDIFDLEVAHSHGVVVSRFSVTSKLPSHFNLSSCIIPKDDSYVGNIYVILCIPDSQKVIFPLSITIKN